MRQDKHIESERTLGFYHLKLLFETENATYSLNSKPCFDIFSSDFNEIGFLFNHLLSPCPTTLHTPHTHPSCFFFFAGGGVLCWVFVAVCKLSLAAASGGYPSLWCMGFSLQWLLLCTVWAPGAQGFSSFSTQVQ